VHTRRRRRRRPPLRGSTRDELAVGDAREEVVHVRRVDEQRALLGLRRCRGRRLRRGQRSTVGRVTGEVRSGRAHGHEHEVGDLVEDAVLEDTDDGDDDNDDNDDDDDGDDDDNDDFSPTTEILLRAGKLQRLL